MPSAPSTRRAVLQTLTGLGTAAVAGPAAATPTTTTDAVAGFDPDDPAAVSDAVSALAATGTPAEAVTALDPVEQRAVGEATQPDRVEHVQDVTSADTAGSWTQARARHVTRLWTLRATIAATFTHVVYWEYNGSAVRNVSVSTRQSTPGTFWGYYGLTTDTKRVNDYNAVSARQGKFKYCGPRFACLQEKHLGTKIWVTYQGNDYAKQL